MLNHIIFEYFQSNIFKKSHKKNDRSETFFSINLQPVFPRIESKVLSFPNLHQRIKKSKILNLVLKAQRIVVWNHFLIIFFLKVCAVKIRVKDTNYTANHKATNLTIHLKNDKNGISLSGTGSFFYDVEKTLVRKHLGVELRFDIFVVKRKT